MPRVPTLQSNVKSIATPAVRQSTDAPVEAFGGQGANYGKVQAAAQNTLDTVGGIYLQEKKKADDARTKDAYSQLQNTKNELFWDPEKGAVSKKGSDAANIVSDYQEEFKKRSDKIREGLSNDTQRSMFDQMHAQESSEFQGLLLRHSNTEFQSYQKTSTEGVVTSSRNDAVVNYAIPGKVDKSISDQTGAITSYLSQQGASDKTIEAAVDQASGQTYAAVIDRQVTLGQDLKAKQYLDEVRPLIKDEVLLRKVEERVNDGSTRGESRRIADAAIAKSKDMTEALAVIKSQNIEDTKVNDMAIDRVKTEYTLKDTAKREQNETVMNGFYNTIQKTRSMGDIMNTAQWDALAPAQKDSLLAMNKRMAEGLDVTTDQTLKNDLLQLASSPDTRDIFLKKNLNDYSHQLNKNDKDYFQKLQYGLRKQDAESLAKLDGIMTDDQIVKNAMLNILRVNPSAKGNADEVAAFRDAVSQRVATEQQATGKKMTDTQKTDLANSMAVKVVTQKGVLPFGLSDTVKPFYKVQPGETFEMQVNEIPSAEIVKIQETLRKAGQPVTNDNVIKLYQAKYFSPKNAGVR